ncbi:MAG: NAD-dependent epimerase/dehydratase family protein, partial [Spirosomataceae bacterium]
MTTNLYGPNDNYDLNNSHELPAMIRKFHEAKESNAAAVELWGTGKPMREFLHADDLADACVYLMQNYHESSLVNIGTGVDVTIKELAETIQEIVGYEGKINWDTEKPDGTPRKLMNVSKLHDLGWQHTINLKEGIKRVYGEYKNNVNVRVH